MVPNGATTYNQTYAYNPVLTLKQQSFSGDGNNYTFSWTYSSAGRLLTFNAPNSTAETFSYDSYGRVAGLTYASTSGAFLTAAQSNYTYDAAGDKLGYQSTQSGVTNQQQAAYNLRREMVGTWGGGGGAEPAFLQRSANGHMVAYDQPGETSSTPGDWDGRTGALLGPDPRADVLDQIYYAQFANGSGTYDARGELASTVQKETVNWSVDGGGCSVIKAIGISYSYDVENRTIANVSGAKPGGGPVTPASLACIKSIPPTPTLSETYAWGPNGHPNAVGHVHRVHINQRNGGARKQ